ncbi:MAG: enoyl-CoA hydratase-related protein [Gammaproteobacteria bacterium]
MPIRFEKRERIALITIDRPEADNAFDPTLSREITEAWIAFRDDPALWVAVLTGAGHRAFCAGADLGALREFYRSLTPLDRRQRAETQPGLGGLTRNLDVWKPIIAAVNGDCFAGGLELALACDIRLASPNASFCLNETSRGVMHGGGGSQRLPRLIPVGIALEMIFTAKAIDAAEAWRIGLVNQVVPSAELLDAALEMANRICANAPLPVQLAKLAVWKGLDLPLADGLRLESTLSESVRQTEDMQEGIKAFLEKRQPQFKGK